MDDSDEKPTRRSISPDPPPYVPEVPTFIDAPLRAILEAAEQAKAESPE